ncbi:hypothetical protein SAMN02746065_11481 [Desulfocicer vacuolatum DSM 3385]|uniref:Uncharacterized protein n=1 Tax=Desulfocicer vacuolatum DSM 3385 TaxID=1121400 RepID=A0A1W2D061_9BACT|nr:hypothetical protein [Desulfocicer vacuolatum]SMC90378.1 hypothetical protein SAMN02746065_11481 [Desulfocicer vacuolatum DSM 3385]
MKMNECLPERMSKLMIGSLLLIGALALVIIGFTLLPVVGFLLAIPVAALGVYFIRVHLNDKCEIEGS